MMYNFPPFGFRNFSLNPYHNLHNRGGFYYKKPPIPDFPKDIPTNNSCNKCPEPEVCPDDNVIDIFGFKLHSDDLLIIALLFFLYKERC